jgi:transposase
MPNANTEAMQKHVEEIGRAVTAGAHALIIFDKAGCHTTRKLKLPDNLTLVPLPPARPELNSAENIWQYLRTVSFLTQCALSDSRYLVNYAPDLGAIGRKTFFVIVVTSKVPRLCY